MVSENLTVHFVQVMPLDFKDKDHNYQFEFMSWVIFS